MNLEEFVEKVELRQGNFKNIADLGEIESTEMLDLREEETEINGKKTVVVKFNIVRKEGDFEVSLPWNVVKSLKEYLKDGIKVTKFKVSKSVEQGRNKYTLLMLESEKKPKLVVENVQ